MLRAKTNTSSGADNPTSKCCSETTPSCRESRTGTGSGAGYGHGTAPWAGGTWAQWPCGSLVPYMMAGPEGPGWREEVVEAVCPAAGSCTRCSLCAAGSCLGWTRMVVSFVLFCFLINQDKTFFLIAYFPRFKQSKYCFYLKI